MHERQVAEVLGRIVSGEQPAPRLDVSRGLADGRRLVRRRRLIIGAAAFTVLGVVGATAVVVAGTVPSSSAHRERAVPAAPHRVVRPGIDSGTFDPLVRSLVVGYVPGPSKEQTYQITPDQQVFSSLEKSDGARDYGLRVVAYPVKRTPDPPPSPSGRSKDSSWTLPTIKRTPTDPVNGHPARCLSGRTSHCYALEFEYAPGGWVAVSYHGAAGNDPAEQLRITRKVAESVRMDEAEPVRLPFTVSGARSKLRPVASFVMMRSSRSGAGRPWEAGISLSDQADGWDPQTHIPRFVRVHVYPDGSHTGDGEKIQAPNTTVDGHPAHRDRNEGHDFLEVFDVNGLHYAIHATHTALVAPFGPDGSISLYRQVTMVPDYQYPQNWTDRPIR